MTPRRCHKFKARPGAKFTWTNALLPASASDPGAGGQPKQATPPEAAARVEEEPAKPPEGAAASPAEPAKVVQSGQAVADALQVMVDGGPSVSNFLVRKLNENFGNVSVTGSVDVDFDLAE